MQRYIICPILSDELTHSFRAAVADLSGTNYTAVIPTQTSGPDVGKPKFNFALCVVSSNNWPAVLALTNSYAFPVYNLDGRMDAMEPETRLALKQSVEAYNLDGQGLHLDATNADADSYRTLMQSILHQFEPAYSLNSFNCSEVPPL